MPDVGIVMPVYNQKESYLRSAIQSILAQSYRDFQLIIVIDGASSDVEKAIIEEVRQEKRVNIIVNQQNQGIATALNLGFRKLMCLSEIEYLTWVSSDNIYYPKFIYKLRKTLKKGPPTLGLVYSCFRHIDDKGKSYHDENFLENFRKWQQQPKEHLLDICFIGASFMYKKIYARLAGDYRLGTVEDYDYWLRLTEHCDIKYIPIQLMDYRVFSPYSISDKLRTSVEHNRRWQYMLQLAKHQARVRRNIPCETTILFPVKDGMEYTVKQLERLLKQYYSNYNLIIIDTSSDPKETIALRKIPDPRILWLRMPSFDEKDAICHGLRNISTPFTLLYGKGSFNSKKQLHNLADQLRQLPEEVISTYYSPVRSVAYRTQPVSNEPVFQELYRTHKLIEIIKR
jgi:glycosyltransferase involved in cell wall biosynthesis